MPYKDPEKAREYQREYHRRRMREDPEYRARQQAVIKRWGQLNPGRRRESSRRYLEKNPQKNREAHLWHKHGLRQDDLAGIWELQDRRCYLCLEPLDLAEVRVDHDHRHCPREESCGTCRRGLAHNGCNVSIGHSGDSPERLRRWADNLEAAQRSVTERLASRHEQLVLDLGTA